MIGVVTGNLGCLTLEYSIGTSPLRPPRQLGRTLLNDYLLCYAFHIEAPERNCVCGIILFRTVCALHKETRCDSDSSKGRGEHMCDPAGGGRGFRDAGFVI